MKLICKMINTAYSEWKDAENRMKEALVIESAFCQLMREKYGTNTFFQLLTDEEWEKYKELQTQSDIEKRVERDAFGAYSFVNRKEWKAYERQLYPNFDEWGELRNDC